MCERKAKKDARAAVVSCATCLSRAPQADASRPALSGWGRPASPGSPLPHALLCFS